MWQGWLAPASAILQLCATYGTAAIPRRSSPTWVPSLVKAPSHWPVLWGSTLTPAGAAPIAACSTLYFHIRATGGRGSLRRSIPYQLDCSTIAVDSIG